MLLYHEGTFWWFPIRYKKNFISKILPIANLNLKFLYEQIRLKTEPVIQSLSEVKANICDGNRNNLAKFILDCMIQNHSDHV